MQSLSSHHNNAGNDEGTSILGERHDANLTSEARKKEKPRMRGLEDIKRVTGRSLNGNSQCKKKVAFISVQDSQKEEIDQCLIMEEATENNSVENAA